MTARPLLKDCPACYGKGVKPYGGPGLCEGACGGSGKVPITQAELDAEVAKQEEPFPGEIATSDVAWREQAEQRDREIFRQTLKRINDEMCRRAWQRWRPSDGKEN